MRNANTIERLTFNRPHEGVRWVEASETDLQFSGLPAWRSNGGPTRGHPARSYPFTLEAAFSRCKLIRLHIVGIFAQFACPDYEAPGTFGASIQLFNHEEIRFHQELVNGLHYSDSLATRKILKTNGDGTTVATVGVAKLDEELHRVDVLTVELPPDSDVDRLKFKALASPASFVIFDVFVEAAGPHGCPFHSAGGGVPLAKIGSIVRLGDRVEFAKALRQLEAGVVESTDLDEARGLALTFLAVLTAALLEIGGSKKLVLEQLGAARSLEHAHNSRSVWEFVAHRIEALAPNLVSSTGNYSDRLMDRALAYVDRNFARPLSDASLAANLGLSTSHFRFLFKQATGQPFHKYLIAARLEKAHRMLIELDTVSVGDVARAVGFVGLSNFSRAFAQRFNVSPASVRKSTSGHA